jgi:hypothetical protein
LFGACLMLAASATHPQSSGGNYQIKAHALDAGGRASGGIYSVHGVIGQAAASTATGGSYSASSGLLRRRAALPDALFANGFE